MVTALACLGSKLFKARPKPKQPVSDDNSIVKYQLMIKIRNDLKGSK